ncbi:septal ring lytic transglycosylase RlpA family protein [Azohydromonas aeria]|uniref:septal ring lytic transglycosylase RlpA family protein n=1 Tax=Azohydromonas aeria TaxID=2590212 RepID=UPI001E52FB22|nr:septal ring lytic transglycosylase RlpA family protein [Azohydromonas aeria]
MKLSRPSRLRHCLALLPLAWLLSLATEAAQAGTTTRAAVHAGTASAGGTPRAAPRKGPAAERGVSKAKPGSAARQPGGKTRQAQAKAKAKVPAAAKAASAAKKNGPREMRRAGAAPARLDYSGRKRVGKASFYAGRFGGRKMADGTRLRLHHPVAASKTLPLGTIAKVTNLRTGKSAVVQIRDRGPFVKGRIVDLTPATARAVGLTAKEGVAPVEVTPIRVPLPDGSVKHGEAAHDPLARTLVAGLRGGD